jgi:hypothetical protein
LLGDRDLNLHSRQIGGNRSIITRQEKFEIACCKQEELPMIVMKKCIEMKIEKYVIHESPDSAD